MSKKVKCDNCTHEIDREHLHRHRIGNYDDLYKCVICGKVLTVGTTQYDRLMANMTVEKMAAAQASHGCPPDGDHCPNRWAAGSDQDKACITHWFEYLNSEVPDE